MAVAPTQDKTDKAGATGDSGYRRVLQYLQGRLLSGELAVGDRLPSERDLSQMLNISRPIVREAIRVLAAIGSLEIRQGHGTVVRKPDPAAFGEFFTLVLAQQSDAVEDILEARIAIERYAIRLACRRATATNLDRLEAALEDIVATIDELEAGGEADARFHALIVEAAHSPTLSSLFSATSALLMRSHIERRKEIMGVEGLKPFLIDHHGAIFAALVERDEATAEKLLDEHFSIGDDLRRKARLLSVAHKFSNR